MINRDMESVLVVPYGTGNTDSYGQTKQDPFCPPYRTTQMMIKVYQPGYDFNDARFNDSTHIGITLDKDISDSDRIWSDNGYYNILYIIPTRRYRYLLLKQV